MKEKETYEKYSQDEKRVENKLISFVIAEVDKYIISTQFDKYVQSMM